MGSLPTAAGEFTISRLVEVPSLAPRLAAAHAREWSHLYANWNESAALSDFTAEGGSADIPTTWVAHHPTHGPMGSVSLVKDDLPGHPDLNPWLASLYVFPEFRGRKLGRILIREALNFLRLRNYPEAFLFTENLASYFSKFNFTFHDHAHAEGRTVTVMKWTNSQPLRV